MNSLQCDKTLKWDDILPPDLKIEWRDVCWQANLTPTIEVDRYTGTRDGRYRLYALTDASHTIYGTVVYI